MQWTNQTLFSQSGRTGLVKGMIKTGFQLRVRTKKLIFLFLNQNICCGYSKEPSQ